MQKTHWVVNCILMCASPVLARGAEDVEIPFSPDGISGTLLIVGGGTVPEDVPRILRAAVGDSSRLVIIADAAEDAGSAEKDAAEWLAGHKVVDTTFPDASVAASDRAACFAELLDEAAAAWICGGQQSRLAQLDPERRVEASLLRLLKRNGTIGGTSAGAAIMSRVMITAGHDEPTIASGWGLLPGAIVDQHFSERGRLKRLQIAVSQHPELFGLGIDEGTAVLVQGRRMQILGQGTASVVLAKGKYRDSQTDRLETGSVADLTQLRRAAGQRASHIDPGEPKFGAAEVSAGSLVIVGGGAMPNDIVNRFVSLAGGEGAQIIVLPTAVQKGDSSTDGVPGFLKKATVAGIRVLPQRGPAEVSSIEFLESVRCATGVWFGGGRQWNFVDAYERTDALELFRDVLRRGGVIGGSSAGATIQGEFLVRGHPLGNTVMMAEGYEAGFAFLPGTAIDQHFTQRNRQPELLSVVQRHPQLLGIGIDEGTALVVQGTRGEIIGLHSAHFVSAKQLQDVPPHTPLPTTPEEAARLYVSVASGEFIDLVTLEKHHESSNDQ